VALVDLLGILPRIQWAERNVVWRDTETSYRVERVRAQWDYEMEGYLLAHCLGTKNARLFNEKHEVFSIRGEEGIPHATILMCKVLGDSPYSMSNDLGTSATDFCRVEGEPLWPLQVRGREDDLARAEFHQIARAFYREMGGEIVWADSVADSICTAHGDRDLKYHYGFLLDEKVNQFTYGYWNNAAAAQMEAAGRSL
jgi:hypothetical protein